MKKPEIKRRPLSITRRRRTSVDEGRQVTHARSKYLAAGELYREKLSEIDCEVTTKRL